MEAKDLTKSWKLFATFIVYLSFQMFNKVRPPYWIQRPTLKIVIGKTCVWNSTLPLLNHCFFFAFCQVCGRLKVEVSRISGDYVLKLNSCSPSQFYNFSPGLLPFYNIFMIVLEQKKATFICKFVSGEEFYIYSLSCQKSVLKNAL